MDVPLSVLLRWVEISPSRLSDRCQSRQCGQKISEVRLLVLLLEGRLHGRVEARGFGLPGAGYGHDDKQEESQQSTQSLWLCPFSIFRVRSVVLNTFLSSS